MVKSLPWPARAHAYVCMQVCAVAVLAMAFPAGGRGRLHMHAAAAAAPTGSFSSAAGSPHGSPWAGGPIVAQAAALVQSWVDSISTLAWLNRLHTLKNYVYEYVTIIIEYYYYFTILLHPRNVRISKAAARIV